MLSSAQRKLVVSDSDRAVSDGPHLSHPNAGDPIKREANAEDRCESFFHTKINFDQTPFSQTPTNHPPTDNTTFPKHACGPQYLSFQHRTTCHLHRTEAGMTVKETHKERD